MKNQTVFLNGEIIESPRSFYRFPIAIEATFLNDIIEKQIEIKPTLI